LQRTIPRLAVQVGKTDLKKSNVKKCSRLQSKTEKISLKILPNIVVEAQKSKSTKFIYRSELKYVNHFFKVNKNLKIQKGITLLCKHHSVIRTARAHRLSTPDIQQIDGDKCDNSSYVISSHAQRHLQINDVTLRLDFVHTHLKHVTLERP
jgi:hypothetical protein